VGRLLLNLLLLRHGYPIAVVHVAQRAEYIGAMEAIQSGGTRDALDALVRGAVARSLRETLETALSSERVVVSDVERGKSMAWIREGV